MTFTPKRVSSPFKADLGVVPFHLGCNALVVHPNCGVCQPQLYTIPFVGAR